MVIVRMINNKDQWQCRKLEPSYMTDGNVNGIAAIESNLVVPYNFKHWVTTWPSNLTPRYITKGIENISTQNLLGMTESSKFRLWWQLHNSVSTLKTTGLCTLSELGSIWIISQ